MDITKLFFIQKTYAQSSNEELTPVIVQPVGVSTPPTNIPTIDLENDLLNKCSKQYGSEVNMISTSQEKACMCNGWSNNNSVSCSTLSQEYLTQKLCGWNNPKYSIWNSSQWTCICAAWLTDTWADGKRECINNAYGNLGIECSPEQMRNGTCSRNINKTLGIRTSDTTSNPTLFVQDIVLAATSFVGTLMVIALVVMWFRYVQGGMDESSTGNLKGNIKKLLIWLGLVIGSYTIIRLIQYVARWY